MQISLNFRLSALQFLQYFVVGSWLVTTGTYLLQTLQFDGREVGLVYTAPSLAAVLTPLFMGAVADRLFASEKLLTALHFIGSLLMLVLTQVQTFNWFFPLLVVYTLFYVPTMALSAALCFHHIRDGQRDYPRIRSWGTVGFILAGILISALDAEATVLPLYIAAVSSLLLGFYCLTLPHTPPKGQRGRFRLRDIFGEEILQLLRQRNFAVLVIALTLLAIPMGFYYSFVNPFLQELGMQATAGKMALGQVSEVVIMLALPWFFRKLSIRRILFIGLLAWGVRYLFFGWSELWMIYLALLLHGVGFNFTILATQIFLDRSVPVSLRSTTQGFLSLITQGVGAFIGAYVAGEVVGFYTLPDGLHNWTAIWMVPAVIGCGVAVFFWVGFRRVGD